MSSSNQDTVVRGTVLLAFAQSLVKLIAFVAVIVLANQLDVTAFGLYNFALAFASLFVPLADLGVDTFLIRELAARPDRRTILTGTAVWMKFMTGVVTALAILAVFALSPSSEVSLELMVLAAALIVLRSWPLTISAIFRSQHLMGLDAVIQVGAKIFELVAILAAVALHTSLEGLYAFLIGGSILHMAIASWMSVRRGFLRSAAFDMPTAFELIRGGVPFAATGISVMLYFHADAVMLTYLVGESETGLYRAATNIVFAISGFSSAVVISLFPMIAQRHDEHREETVRLTSHAVTYSVLFTLPLAVGGSILAQPIVDALYRTSYGSAGPLLAVLLWWLPFSFVTNVLGHALGAIGRQSVVLRVAGINAVFNVALNLVLIPIIGALGAAITTVATELLGLAMLQVEVARRFGRVFRVGRLIRIAAASAPLALLGLLTGTVHPVWLVGAGALLYGGTSLALGAITTSDIRYLWALARGHRRPETGA